jgi:hypothetical protein
MASAGAKGSSPKWLRIADPRGTRIVDSIEADFRRKRGTKRQRLREALNQHRSNHPPIREALLKAATWENRIEVEGVCRADIARQEGVSRARVTQLMHLLTLPEDTRRRAESGMLDVEGQTLKGLIQIAAADDAASEG